MEIEGFRGKLNPEMEARVNVLVKQIGEIVEGKDFNDTANALWNVMYLMNLRYLEMFPGQKDTIFEGLNFQYDLFLHNLEVTIKTGVQKQ